MTFSLKEELSKARKMPVQQGLAYLDDLFEEYGHLVQFKETYLDLLLSDFMERQPNKDLLIISPKMLEDARQFNTRIKELNLFDEQLSGFSKKRIKNCFKRVSYAEKRHYYNRFSFLTYLFYLIEWYFLAMFLAAWLGFPVGLTLSLGLVIWQGAHYLYPYGWQLNRRRRRKKYL